MIYKSGDECKNGASTNLTELSLTPDRMEIQTPPWPRLWHREYHKTLRCSVLRGRAPILSIKSHRYYNYDFKGTIKFTYASTTR
jgi:hypothetical protein